MLINLGLESSVHICRQTNHRQNDKSTHFAHAQGEGGVSLEPLRLGGRMFVVQETQAEYAWAAILSRFALCDPICVRNQLGPNWRSSNERLYEFPERFRCRQSQGESTAHEDMWSAIESAKRHTQTLAIEELWSRDLLRSVKCDRRTLISPAIELIASIRNPRAPVSKPRWFRILRFMLG